MFRTWRRWLKRPARSTPSNLRSRARLAVSTRVFLESLEDRLAPAAHVWCGTANSLWSNASNWAGGTPAGDPNADIIFPTNLPSLNCPLGVLNLSSVNDMGTINVQSLTFNGVAIILNSLPGTGLRLRGGIIDEPLVAGLGNVNTIRSQLFLTGGAAHVVNFRVDFPRTLTIEGVVTGDAPADALTKSGPGTLVLSGNNTFQGGVTVNAAPFGALNASVLGVGHDRALGLGLLRLAGGVLTPTTGVTLANAFDVTATSYIDGDADLTLTGIGNLAAGRQLRVQNYAITTFSNTLGGAGSLRVDAEIDSRIARGKVILSGSNAYTGGTTLATGILGVTTNTALGVGRFSLFGGFFQNDNPNAALTFANVFSIFGTPQMTGANSFTITGAGIFDPGATLNLSNILGTITLSGNLTGPGSILRTAAGSAILGGNNAHTGGTTIRGGTLAVTQSTSLGTGLLDFAGGTLRVAAPVTIANLFQVSGDSGLAGNSNVVFSSPGAFTGSVTFSLTITNTAVTTFTNVIAGTGLLRVDAGATGVVNFFGVNTYSGGTTLLSGLVTVNSDRSLGVGIVTLSGGGIQANAPSVLPNTILVNAPSTISGTNNLTITGGVTLLAPPNSVTIRNTAVTTFTNVINGAGQIIMNGAAGTLNLPALNTYTGGTTLAAGTLVASNNLSLGTGPIALNGGRLLPTTALTFVNDFSVNGNPVLDVAFDLTFTGFGNLIGGTLNVRNNGVTTFTHSAFLNMTGAGGITKLDGGTLVLTSNSNFGGGVTLSAGILRLSHPNALGVGVFTINGGTVLADTPVTVGNSVNVNGSAAVGGDKALTFGPGGVMTLAAGVTLTIANTAATTIDQVMRGAGALAVTAGLVTLSGANTYTGPTSVTGGTLLVNGTQTGSPITVTGANLGGSGTTGRVTVLGGKLIPGTGPGILRNAGNVALNSASTLILELNGDNPGSGFDQLVTTGVIDLNSDGGVGAFLDLRPGYIPVVGKAFIILQSTGGIKGAFQGLPEGSLVTVGDLSFRVTYRGGASGNDVVLTRTLTNTTLALTSSLNPSNPGSPVTFNVRVAATGGLLGSPTGTVTFFEGANVLAVVALADGQASFTTNAFTSGTYAISAVYSGDGNFTPSAPGLLTQTVQSDLTQQINQRYVRQLYRDLLGREAEGAGLTAFTQMLDNNQITRAGTVFAMQNSQEYRQRVVREAYRRILGREADAVGLAGWTAFLAQGGTSQRLDVLLFDSVEFFQVQGGGTNDGYLQALYRIVLNRTVDGLGQQLWSARFAANSPRGAIAEEIVASTEAQQRVVDQIFRTYLRRAPETAALNAFVTALQNGSATRELVIAAVTASTEYYQRA